MKNKSSNIRFLAVNALLAAVICVVSFLPIRTLGLEITLSMVPVAIGACLYGPMSGALLGGVFGVVSFIQCFGYSPFGAVLLGENPLLTAIVCIPTRILAGLLAGLIAVAIGKLCKKEKSTLALAVGSVAAPVLNTLFFMSALVLCFWNTEYIQGFAGALGAANPFIFVILFVGINGLVEIVAGFILALPLSKALSKIIE